MKTILFCWELGDDYGHIGQAHPIITYLSTHFNVYFAVKDLSKIRDIIWPLNVHFIQAPIWLKTPQRLPRSETHAEILFYKGYDKVSHLKGLVDGWITLLKLVSPDLIVFDHAPSALIAARTWECPSVIISNPFITPAPGSDIVNICPGLPFNAHKAEQINNHVVSTINTVLTSIQSRTIEKLSDIYQVNSTILSSYQEMDIYKPYRQDVTYTPTLPGIDSFASPQWPPGMSVKAFAYLKHGKEQSQNILNALTSIGIKTLCFYSGCKDEDTHKYKGLPIIISKQPYDITTTTQQADIIICHGGKGVVNTALYYGKPLIIAPTQIEQRHTAQTIEHMGLGIMLDQNTPSIDVENKIIDFFSQITKHKERCQIFSETAKQQTPESSLNIIVNIIKGLI